MTNYHVKWAIDIEAQTPVEAAQKALEIQRDKSSIATFFDVKEPGAAGLTFKVDLLGDEPNVSLVEPSAAETPRAPMVDVTPGIPVITQAASARNSVQEIIDWSHRYHKPPFTADEVLKALQLMTEANLCANEAAAQVFAERPVDSRKPYEMIVKVEIAYSIPAASLPAWVDACGVEKLVESAFDDWNKPLTLEAFGKGGVLDLEPVEISIDTVLQG